MVFSQKGFSLIELMTVVGIIGVLSAVALPQYAKYQAKAKVTAALAEISALKTGHDSFTNDGGTIDSFADIGANQGTHCKIYIQQTEIQCDILNGPSVVTSKSIRLTRTADGTWSCISELDSEYLPKGCTNPTSWPSHPTGYWIK